MKFPGKNGKKAKAINKYLIETFFRDKETFQRTLGMQKDEINVNGTILLFSDPAI